MTPAPTIDLDLLDLDARQASAWDRRAMGWLVGLLLLVALSTVGLALFLVRVEAQETDRQRTADAEWLDQTLRFHFRRLEDDLATLARQQQPSLGGSATLARAGGLWRGPGVIARHGWIPASQQAYPQTWSAALRAAAAPQAPPEQAGALLVMLDTGRGLQRAAYAGPLPPVAADHGAWLWLAVPLIEQGRFQGSYVAAIDVERALEQVVPAWFLQHHGVRVASDGAAQAGLASPSRYFVPVNLPGAQWTLEVQVLDEQPALAPRAFFGVALLCLSGMVVALYLLARDVARRRRAEAKWQSQVALRGAMERAVTLGLRAWGLDGRLLYANQAFGRMVGWTPQELIAHAGPAPYWPAEQGDEFQCLRQSVADASAPPLGREWRLRHRDGHELEVLVHTAPLTQADGRVIGWMGSALDVTERKRIERLAARQQDKLEASARLVAVGEVASTLAHELNQPLGALSSFANGLLNRLREGRITFDEVVPVVERMERMADKAGRVIQRVNAFARRQEMTRQPLALIAFLRRVVAQVPCPPGVTLQVQCPTEELMVPADALLLEHAVHNVVLNATEWAVRGTRAPALVRVSLTQTDSQVGIVVEDSGPGVPLDQQGRIFEAFASQKDGGMGMGLSIGRSIVEAHHGRIEVGRSTALGGAQFTVWLPLHP